tara:strand:+ start:297 stop:416 length:120 start_codon:yes stop_codon:yes gene_type:complete
MLAEAARRRASRDIDAREAKLGNRGAGAQGLAALMLCGL